MDDESKDSEEAGSSEVVTPVEEPLDDTDDKLATLNKRPWQIAQITLCFMMYFAMWYNAKKLRKAGGINGDRFNVGDEPVQTNINDDDGFVAPTEKP